MRFKSPLEASKYAESKREEIAPASSSAEKYARGTETVERNSPIYKRIFELQGEIERHGPMDYRKYAKLFWREATGSDADEGNKNFQVFERNFIANMHDIPMRDLVYTHVLELMPRLIEKYADSIKHLSLWSKGDVAATGYQVAKIESSRIAHDFMREIARQVSKETRRSFLEQKTSYDVADDKFENLIWHVGQTLDSSDDQVKVVIIEDSYKSFDAARQVIENALGKEAARRVDVEPIWAVYSREGTRAREEGRLSMDDFRKKHANVRPIESFEELMDDKRFGELFRDAHVFVDFDGVIGDNLRMRDVQASVTLTAGIDGLLGEWGVSREEARQRLERRIASKENG